MYTSSTIKRGSLVRLNFPPIIGQVTNVNRNRSAFLVDFGEFRKWFAVHRLTLVPPAEYPRQGNFQFEQRADYAESIGPSQPGSSTEVTPTPDQAQLPGTF